MTLLYFIFATKFFQLLAWLFKVAFIILLTFFAFKGIRRLIISINFEKITRMTIVGQKDIIQKSSIPTGYSEGYYRTEHYKYEFKKTGVKYRTRVYFGGKFFIPYSFKDSDPLYQKIISNSNFSQEQ